MTIYEIDEQIQELLNGSVDEETGELIFNEEALEALAMERDRKIENCACAVKNFRAQAKAIKDEANALKKRAEALERRADHGEEFIDHVLNGTKFNTAKVSISYGKSKSVEVDEGFIAWASKKHKDLLRFKEPEANKTEIKKFLAEGGKTKFARIIEKVNMRIS